VALAPGGRYLYIARRAYLGRRGLVPASILQIRAPTSAPARVFPLRRFGSGTPILVSPDGKTVYLASTFRHSDAVKRLRVPSGKEAKPIPFGSYRNQIWQLAISGNGRRLYVLSIGQGKGALTQINAVTGRVIGSVPIPGHPMDMAIMPGGKRLYVTSEFNHVTVVRTATLSVVKSLTVGFAWAVAITPDGRAAYVTGSAYQTTGDGQVTAIRTASNLAKLFQSGYLCQEPVQLGVDAFQLCTRRVPPHTAGRKEVAPWEGARVLLRPASLNASIRLGLNS